MLQAEKLIVNKSGQRTATGSRMTTSEGSFSPLLSDGGVLPRASNIRG